MPKDISVSLKVLGRIPPMLDEPNLEKDLLSSDTIANKAIHSDIYAQNLYAALCNNRFFYGDKEWTCSWRMAGGIVAELVDTNGDYMDYYCSGISSKNGYVSEGFVTDEIKLDLMKLGWTFKPYESKLSSRITKNS